MKTQLLVQRVRQSVAARRLRGAALSCLFSFAITAALLLLMRHLVATTDAAYEEGPPLRTLVFARTVQDPEPPPRKRPPERPKPPKQPPKPLPDNVDIDSGGEPSHYDPVPPVLPKLGPVISQGRMPIPFLTPAPEYPQRALARGIEGWVLLSFTIAETGAVVDPKVVNAEPPGMFDAAALRAIVRYKYRPQIAGGVPTPTPGMMLRIHFELED